MCYNLAMDNTKIFLKNEERKAIGGTCFHELQYCVKDLPIKELLHWKNVSNWASDSLYIEAIGIDDEVFYDRYNKIFSQFGKVDYFGINYYSREQTKKILCDLQNQELPDVKNLIYWLETCVKSFNGFYFLGV